MTIIIAGTSLTKFVLNLLQKDKKNISNLVGTNLVFGHGNSILRI